MENLALGWQFDPVLIGSLVTLAVCYALATGPLRTRLAPGQAYPAKQAFIFYSGLALIYLIEGSPLHDLAERYSFSAHMVQHLLLSYLAAPLLIWGSPRWLLRPLLLNRFTKPFMRILTKPLVALVIFNFLFSIWHFPAIYEGALANSSLHHSEHLVFLATALLLWWPLMSPLSELPRLPYLGQLLYLFVIPVAQLPVFAFVTFADHALYPTYAAAPQLWLDVKNDQALGGALMKVLGLFAFGIPFIFIFFRWFHEDKAFRFAGRGAEPGMLEPKP